MVVSNDSIYDILRFEGPIVDLNIDALLCSNVFEFEKYNRFSEAKYKEFAEKRKDFYLEQAFRNRLARNEIQIIKEYNNFLKQTGESNDWYLYWETKINPRNLSEHIIFHKNRIQNEFTKARKDKLFVNKIIYVADNYYYLIYCIILYNLIHLNQLELDWELEKHQIISLIGLINSINCRELEDLVNSMELRYHSLLRVGKNIHKQSK